MDNPSVLERTKHGQEIIEDAMSILIMVYRTIPLDEHDDTPVEISASRIIDVLEMFFAYVDQIEDIDIQSLVNEIDMDVKSSMSMFNDKSSTKKVH